ncbi:hypothetical protein FRC19_003206 [Serendipita sp. 401]|nr:hypothetical protein FRC15_004166 [Serendipita sp. 397]KAG8779409.1 hypothetical protein FRC16_003435 [Serendipita sp. 398]KAG8812310.1 hypothetical protein FRC19_003206 [Serendipita sp. 401]KAG8845562.1 hypothetical protein FRC20_003157 [Serendipita sp. 405]KAG9042265.1 hypothetical protein FS842_002243 [Serendipita sp. 407]
MNANQQLHHSQNGMEEDPMPSWNDTDATCPYTLGPDGVIFPPSVPPPPRPVPTWYDPWLNTAWNVWGTISGLVLRLLA